MKSVLLGLALVTLASTAWAQAQGRPDAATSFRVSWEARTGAAPTIAGTVHNGSAYRVTNVRLRVEGVDGDGKAVGERLTWAFGDIAPGAATTFVVERVPAAVDYRIAVQSFDLVSGPQAP